MYTVSQLEVTNQMPDDSFYPLMAMSAFAFVGAYVTAKKSPGTCFLLGCTGYWVAMEAIDHCERIASPIIVQIVSKSGAVLLESDAVLV